MSGDGVVLVFVGGDRVSARVAAHLPVDAFVIGADSGVDHALAARRTVDLAVGDFDSVSAAGLERVEAAGGAVERHAAEKDQTDFELALDRAIERNAERIIVVGGHGGRLDHLLGNIGVLASDRYAAARVEAWFDEQTVHVVRGSIELVGLPGDLVALLAHAGPVDGVTTTGLRYPLSDESLEPGSSRGVSNELVGARATVEVGAGTLLVIRPRG